MGVVMERLSRLPVSRRWAAGVCLAGNRGEMRLDVSVIARICPLRPQEEAVLSDGEASGQGGSALVTVSVRLSLRENLFEGLLLVRAQNFADTLLALRQLGLYRGTHAASHKAYFFMGLMDDDLDLTLLLAVQG
jgi:hypothetical protein